MRDVSVFDPRFNIPCYRLYSSSLYLTDQGMILNVPCPNSVRAPNSDIALMLQWISTLQTDIAYDK